ncbi:restriction endonuclease subunit S [Citrobacter braakii]|uniref:restriction endonuclease subunit S n=1 Tax=Citrobacter braakii TaxID=57706 RepID=UPI002433F8EC|nr:restriction endonuclease subunit S [Citrobacter braakii]WFV80699.1 restriction endonuclease subunit S [Citrobacter braakii]
MAKYKAYPQYKDSGVEWLQTLPARWSTVPLKFLCTCNDQVISDSTDKDYEIEYVDIGSVSSSLGITTTENMSFSKAPSRARRLVKDGDIIISTVRTYLEAIAPIIKPPANMVVSTGFAVIRPSSNLDNRFASYCLRASGFIKEVVSRSVGISYPAINSSDLVNIPIPNCTLHEQLNIATFLDHETAKIDNLIEKQHQLIELLKEKRHAVISHVVTKGLNPDVPMKDSGFEWVGEIPMHWKTKAMKNICRIINGSTPKSGVEEFWDGEINWVTPTDLSQKSGPFISESIRKITFSGFNSCGTTLVPRDSVIISTRAPIGSLAITSIDSCTNQGCKSLVTNNAGLSKFIYYYLSILSTPLNILGRGSTFLELSTEDLSSVKVPLPDEKINSIISFLDQETTKIDNLLEKQQQIIQLLQERRTALISAAVTGKIDVRNWVAPGEQTKAESPAEAFA